MNFARTVMTATKAMFSVLGLAAFATGCASASDHPLGGPYGGTAELPGPSAPDSVGGAGPGGDPTGDGTGSGDATGGGAGTADAGSGKTGGATGGSDAGSDAGSAKADSGSGASTAAPTWSSIFTKYLKGGTKGDCTSCHGQMSTASKSYTWLNGRGYLSNLTNPSSSCISWYGGNMPPSGPSTFAAATADMNAWVAAGSLNN